MELHIGNKNYSSWSMRPWVLLTELGIPFVERLHWFPARGTEPHSFFAFSPTGQVPCLVDGPLRIADSLAIVETVGEAHPNVWPLDRGARAWARSAAAQMHAGFGALRRTCTMNVGVRARLHALPADTAADIARIDALWCDGLSQFGGPFLAGSAFSAADAFFAPVAYRIQTYGLSLSARAMAYAERLRATGACDAWYQAALSETARDVAHEQELLASATIVQDLRRT